MCGKNLPQCSKCCNKEIVVGKFAIMNDTLRSYEASTYSHSVSRSIDSDRIPLLYTHTEGATIF